jgi:hypothetical protein
MAGLSARQARGKEESYDSQELGHRERLRSCRKCRVFPEFASFWAMIRRRHPWLEVAISVVSSITLHPA